MNATQPKVRAFTWNWRPFISVAGMFLVVLCLGFTACWQIYQQSLESERRLDEEMAKQRSQAMTMWINDQLALASALAKTLWVRNVCLDPHAREPRLAAERFLKSIHDSLSGYSVFTVMPFLDDSNPVMVSNADGSSRFVHSGQVLVDSIEGRAMGIGGSSFNYIEAIRNGQSAFISEAKLNAVPGLPPVFVVAVPIFAADGERRIGCMAIGIMLEHFATFFTRNIRVGKTGSLKMLDDRGRFIDHEDPTKILAPDETDTNTHLLTHLQQGKKHFTLNEANGAWKYSAAEVLPGYSMATRWWVLLKRDANELANDLMPPLARLAILCLGLFALAAILIRKVNKSLQQSLEDKALHGELELRRNHHEELTRERSVLRKIIDNIHGIIFLRDPEGHYLIVNKHFTPLIGLCPEDIIGKKYTDVLPGHIQAFSTDSDLSTVNSPGAYTVEHSMRLHDGTLRDFLFIKEALHSSDGQYEGILGIGIDITELKEVQRELADAKERAEEANVAKSAFLSTISHEIRTPMNAIVGFVHLFARENLTAKQKDYLEKIRMASASLLAVINNVLELSKIESGKLELEHTPFRLRDRTDSVINVTSEAAHAKGLTLEVAVAPEVPELVLGDPTRVHQILLNLVNNAIKFTATGSVRVTVELASPEDSHEDMDPDCLSVRFRVADTGIGMTGEQAARVFQPFTQADVSTTRKYGGTGLGLSICKELAELMGGRISVRSQLGQGSEFSLLLPLRPAHAPKPAGEDLPEQGCSVTNLGGKRVLLVEDNLINQEIACAFLQRFGLHVETADDGAAALEKLKIQTYDLVFMDMQMPVMDGLEATRRLRALGKEAEGSTGHENWRWLQTVPVIAMTANAMAEDRQKCLEAGMNDHIGKPIEPSVLCQCLLLWLTRAA